MGVLRCSHLTAEEWWSILTKEVAGVGARIGLTGRSTKSMGRKYEQVHGVVCFIGAGGEHPQEIDGCKAWPNGRKRQATAEMRGRQGPLGYPKLESSWVGPSHLTKAH